MIALSSLALVAALAAAPTPAPPAPEQIMQVPAELHAMLQRRVLARTSSRQERLERLVEMIFAEDGLALRYDAAATHTVGETFATRRANCLSFTLLFVALARQSGLPARAQEIGQVLSWYQDQGTLYTFGHVNAQVRVDGRSGTVDLDSSVLMDRRGPRPIDDARAYAHYYNNRGSELLAAGDLAGARTYFRHALRMDAGLAGTWNNLGVLEARSGDPAAAARHYAEALALDPRHVSTLSNAVNLYRRLGEPARAEGLLRRLQRIRTADPFQQYLLGMQAERRGDYAVAIGHYRRAVRLYPGAHQLRFGLARAYLLGGNGLRAERELLKARELGGDADKARYQAKLDSLQRARRQPGTAR